MQEDFYKEKTDLIRKIIEKNYDKKRFKQFINKEKYLEKNLNYYTKRISIIEDAIKKYNNIENYYVSYYCDNMVKKYMI